MPDKIRRAAIRRCFAAGACCAGRFLRSAPHDNEQGFFAQAAHRDEHLKAMTVHAGIDAGLHGDPSRFIVPKVCNTIHSLYLVIGCVVGRVWLRHVFL